MLTPINTLPLHVFGITASGTVSKQDIETILIPGLQNLVDRYNEIYYLLVLETEVGNFTASAWLGDMKAGIQNFTKWKKIAVVTSQKGVEKFTDIFSFVVPGESRGFATEELEEAKSWISIKE